MNNSDAPGLAYERCWHHLTLSYVARRGINLLGEKKTYCNAEETQPAVGSCPDLRGTRQHQTVNGTAVQGDEERRFGRRFIVYGR